MHLTYVKKKDGSTEEFLPEKINKWVEWACHDTTANWSLIITSAIKKMYDGATTSQLQRALIDSATDLIDTDVDYDIVAARLQLADMRKRAYGCYVPPKLADFYHRMIELGKWEDMNYNESDLDMLSCSINHDKDELFAYGGLKQMADKYLIKDFDNLYETPQFLYMGMAMSIFKHEPLEDVIGLYDILSDHKINIPTPVLVGLRSRDRGFASCCLIKSGDSLQSINAAINVAYTMTANRAGIGMEMGVRSEGDPVRGGAFVHLGKLPYYNLIDRTVKANSQESRGGSATVQFCIFDPEIESLIRLKSQRVADERRIDKLDYSMAINDYFIRKVIKDEEMALFSINDAPHVYEKFFSKDLEGFIKVYEDAILNPKMPKQMISAKNLFASFMKERVDTGRMYVNRIDVVNIRSTYKDPIFSSNLCQEIVEPTKGYSDVTELYKEDGDGEVALCNLAAFVLGRISDEEYPRVAYLTLKMVDTIIDIQDYPYAAIKFTAQARRSIGVGLINVAYAMAKNGHSYESEAGRNFIHRETEKYSFWLHKASVQLAKERGRCEWFGKTTYADGILPMDSAPVSLAGVHTQDLEMDWPGLREEIAEHGMRNSVLEAEMPSETSSVTIRATNSCEPVRSLIVHKSSNTGTIPFIVPEYKDLLYKYELAFDVDQQRYAEIIGIMQKFIGQSISYNEYYDYNKYPGGIIPINTVMKNFIYGAKMGIKTWYYLNSDVDNGGASHQGCDSGGCTL